MSTSLPTTSQLEKVLELSKKKDAIQADLEKIDQEIAAVLSGAVASIAKVSESAAAAPASKPAKARGRKPRAKKGAAPKKAAPKAAKAVASGSVKDQVLAVLEGAGPEGLSVGEIADKIGWKRSSANVWFYTTGKKVREIKKVGRGRFALK